MRAQQIDQVLFAHGGDPEQYDVVLVQRDVIEPDHVDAFLTECRRRRVRLVVDLDDDLVTEPARLRLLDHGYARTKLDALTSVLEQADAVIVSTQPLAELMQSSTRSVTVVPNSLDPGVWPGLDVLDPRQRGGAVEGDTVRILYAGTVTHSEDLALLRTPILALQSEGRPVLLETVGITETPGDWFSALPLPDAAVNYPDFASWLLARADRWVLGVAPLAEHSFNHAKSDLKFLEYSALGLPTVASNAQPYAGIGEHGGQLVDTDTGAWTDALRALLDDPAERAARVVRARRHLTAERSDPGGTAWVQALLGR